MDVRPVLFVLCVLHSGAASAQQAPAEPQKPASGIAEVLRQAPEKARSPSNDQLIETLKLQNEAIQTLKSQLQDLQARVQKLEKGGK